MKKQAWLTSVVLVMAAGTGLAANIVVNGGFENPVVPTDPGYQQTSEIPAWGVEGPSPFVIDKAHRPNVPEGNQCIQLQGLVGHNPGDIYQLFTGLTPGDQYTVRYAQAQRGDDVQLSVLNVQWKYWEGGVFGTTNHVLYQQTTTETAATYAYHEFTVTAQHENDYLVFLAAAVDVGGVMTSNMPNLDDVSVELVSIPEPASLALLLLGGTVLLRRRRR